MNQGKENIDKNFQDKLLQAEVSPPDSVWQGIEKTLNKKRKVAIVLLYQRLAVAAAVILLALLSFFFIRSNRIESENKIAQEQIIESIPISDEYTIDKKSESQFSILGEKTNVDSVISKTQKRTTEQAFTIETSPIDKTIVSAFAENYIELIPYKNQLLPIKFLSLSNNNSKNLKSLKINALNKKTKYEEILDGLAFNSSKPTIKTWSLGLAISPTYINQGSGNATLDYLALYSSANAENRTVSEKVMPAYSGGLNLVYQISERWSIQSGIYYLKQGQRIENFSVIQNTTNANFSSNSYFGQIIFDNPTLLNESRSSADYLALTDMVSYSIFNADLNQQFELLEIPLLAKYKLIDRAFDFYILAGFNQGILVGNRVFLTDYSSKAVGKTDDINSLIYKSVFGVSFEYPFARKLYFTLSPALKYQLNNFNKNNMESEKLQYFEVKTGLNYRF